MFIEQLPEKIRNHLRSRDADYFDVYLHSGQNQMIACVDALRLVKTWLKSSILMS